MIIPVKTSQGQYNIVLQRGILSKADTYLNLNRKVFIITDSGVPSEYAKTVAKCCKEAKIVTFPQGESSKQIETYKFLLEEMINFNITRSDCVVAVGGGVVGDLAGFVAATYMRGIDFYNIPTTVLSQVDSSIGGKTAIDFMGFKNIVGAFYPPKAVLIDPDTLSTLPERQISNGLAEAVKMAMTSDRELFELFEKGKENYSLDEVIAKALNIKKQVVEEDEHENGVRKILNFGHTLAHAIESVNGMETYYHGECVAMGMIPMCSENVVKRLKVVLNNLNLPTYFSGNLNKIIEAVKHDKKMSGEDITVVFVEEIGTYKLKRMPFYEYEKLINRGLEK